MVCMSLVNPFGMCFSAAFIAVVRDNQRCHSMVHQIEHVTVHSVSSIVPVARMTVKAEASDLFYIACMVR